jgi:hypothetical protein
VCGLVVTDLELQMGLAALRSQDLTSAVARIHLCTEAPISTMTIIISL